MVDPDTWLSHCVGGKLHYDVVTDYDVAREDILGNLRQCEPPLRLRLIVRLLEILSDKAQAHHFASRTEIYELGTEEANSKDFDFVFVPLIAPLEAMKREAERSLADKP